MATYYVQPDVASATASTNINSPGNSIANALTAAVGPNDTIYVARGYVLKPQSLFTGIYIGNKNPTGKLVITGYGSATMPTTLSGGTWETAANAADWTYVSDGVWRKPYAAAADVYLPKRLFVGAQITGPAGFESLGTGYTTGTPVARAQVATTATEAQCIAALNLQAWTAKTVWSCTRTGGGVLYIYTGGSTPAYSPPIFFGGLLIIGGNNSTYGTANGISWSASSNVEVSCIDVVGVNGFSLYMHTDASTIGDKAGNAARDINIYAHGAYGAGIYGDVTNGRILNAVLENVNVYGRATSDEQPNPVGDISFGINGIVSGFTVRGYVDGITIRKSMAHGCCHGGFIISPFESSQPEASCQNVLYSDCRIVGTGAGYHRGLALQDASSSCKMQGMVGYNLTQWAQIQGYGTITDSAFSETQYCYPNYLGRNNIVAMSVGIAIKPRVTAPKDLPVGAVVLNRLTMQNPVGFVIQVIADTGETMSAGAIVAQDNVIDDKKYLATRMQTSSYPVSGRSISYVAGAGITITDAMSLVNNIIDSATYNGTDSVVYQVGGAITTGTIAAVTGSSGNVTAESYITADGGRPYPTSPAIGSATFAGYGVRDIDRVQRGKIPSKGAYELPTQHRVLDSDPAGW